MSKSEHIGDPAELRNSKSCQAYEDYVQELRNWEEAIKVTDSELRLQKLKLRESRNPAHATTPRDTSKHRRTQSKATSVHKEEHTTEEMEGGTTSTEDEDLSEEEKLEAQWKRQKALMAKDKGNQLYKEGKYDLAIESYTTGIECDPTNAMLYANRAMALLRKSMFAAAEEDCARALAWDPTYVKAYHRRGVARVALGKYDLAGGDFRRVLELDPANKEASQQLEKLPSAEQRHQVQTGAGDGKGQSSTNTTVLTASLKAPSATRVYPISKPENLRSKKPLKRIHINEAGAKKSPAGDGTARLASRKSKVALAHSPVLAAQHQPDLPLPAQTSFQFLADWKRTSRFPEQQYQYLKQMDPAKLPVVFKQALESELFADMLSVLDKFFMRDGIDVYPFLSHLTKVGRFSTLTMLLGSEETHCLQRLFSYVRKHHSEDDCLELQKLYGL